MKVKFVRFQMLYNGVDIWINPLTVNYVLKDHDNTCLVFAGGEDAYVIVVGGVKEALKKLEDGINGSRD